MPSARRNDFKIIIAPHETGNSHMEKLVLQFGEGCIRYSTWDKKSVAGDVLLIDNVGMLSSLYKFADVAYIGGGFGNGIHNILEAAVFGIPVFFGPVYKKFREAEELIHWKGAFSIRNSEELISKFNEVMSSPERLTKIREINKRYIDNNKGSTELIIEHLKVNHPELEG